MYNNFLCDVNFNFKKSRIKLYLIIKHNNKDFLPTTMQCNELI